jgi:hypothetical protein
VDSLFHLREGSLAERLALQIFASRFDFWRPLVGRALLLLPLLLSVSHLGVEPGAFEA